VGIAQIMPEAAPPRHADDCRGLREPHSRACL